MSLIPNASKKSLGKFITENIMPESVLLTDGWKGYDGLSTKGYKREIKDNAKVLDGEEILPNVHAPVTSITL